tara:strand:+ start:120 stop:743 length:624 start_codon:yes stop_codon:yes gene_type:complete
MKSDIIQLFSKPIYKTIMPLDFVPITKWLNSQKMSDGGDIQNYGCKSLDTYIFSNKECEEISNYILKLVKDFGDKLGYQYEDYKFTQSWLTWKYPGQSHTSHTHANSLISGVFYYDYVDQNTPSIVFSDKEFLELNFKPSHIPNENYKFSYHVEEINVEPGMLVLFPSYLPHAVPVNTTNYIRKSLSFNIVPKKGLGVEKYLTELLF